MECSKENLLDIDPKNSFLSHFWSSFYGRSSKTGLFRTIRDQIDTATQAVDFANKIGRCLKNLCRITESK